MILMSGIVRRPLLGKDSSTCFKCGSRILLPRKTGNTCSRCYKQIHDKTSIDDITKEFFRRLPAMRKR